MGERAARRDDVPGDMSQGHTLGRWFTACAIAVAVGVAVAGAVAVTGAGV